MNTFKFISILALAAFIMAACGNDEENVSAGSDAGNAPAEVRFSARTAEIQTRVAGNSWAANDPVGIYMIDADGDLTSGTIREDAANRQYTASADGIAAEFAPVGADKIYYPMSGNVEFIAYHPYKATGITANFKLPVSVAEQGSQTAIDVLYAAKTNGSYSKSTKSTPVELQFTHKLVKLVFSISAPAEYGVTESLNDLTVNITNQQTKAELDLTNGNVSASGATSEITANTATGGTSSEAIVLPNSGVTGMTFTFTTTGAGSGTYEVAVPAPATAGWESGKKYAYTVTLKRNDVKISGEVSDWNDGGSESITADPQLYFPIVYTNPEHTQKLYMLSYNLGVTDEGKSMTVEEQMEAAKNLTTSNDVPAITGGLFQWGRVADGHELRSSGSYSGPVAVDASDGQVVEGNNGYGLFITSGSSEWRNSYSPAKWEGASDPCSCVKDGGKAWRLPTSAEWQQIINYNSPETPSNPIGLRLKPDGSTVSVFLPAAGSRYRATGALSGEGANGSYWSSSPSGTDASNLSFITTVTPANYNYRSYGFSVRCVAE